MKKASFKISDEEIVKIYLETNSLRKTAMAAQEIKGTSTIANKLKSLGIEVKNHFLKPITASDEELVSMYNSGMSLMEIAKQVSGSKGAMIVRQKLQKLGVDTSYINNIHKYKEKMSKIYHQYTLDEHVFDSINTEEKAYWLGFLMADGYNHENKHAIVLRLQSEDAEILEKFRGFLKSDAPIYTFKKITKVNHLQREYKEVRVNSPHLSKKLAELGCVQGKTYTLEFPTCVPDNLISHFIRGYFDGDGCITITNRTNRRTSDGKEYQFTLTGRKEFLEVVQQYLIDNVGVSKTLLNKFSRSFVQSIHYNGRNTVSKILDYIYKDATIFLKRKHDKYLQIVVRRSNPQELINSVNSGKTLRA